MTLERPVITRWSYYYQSVAKVKLRYGSLLVYSALQSCRELWFRGCNWSEWTLQTVAVFRKFVVNLHAAKKVLKVTNSLSNQLQSKELLLSEACSLIQSIIKELQVLRTDEGFSNIFDKAKIFFFFFCCIWDSYKLERLQSSRQTQEDPKDLIQVKTFLTDSTLGISEDNTSLAPEVSFKRIYFDILDRFSPRRIIDSLIICHW